MTMPDRPPGGNSSTDAISGKRTFRNGVAQVDVCPGEVGFILSIGRVSLWVNTDEAAVDGVFSLRPIREG